MIISKNSTIPETELLDLIKKSNIGITLKTKPHLTYETDSYWANYKENAEKESICFCQDPKGTKINNYCPYCGNGLTRTMCELATNDYTAELAKQEEKVKEEVKEYEKKVGHTLRIWRHFDKDKKKKLYDKYYICQHPDYEYRIIIKKITIEATTKKNEICLTGKLERYIEIVPGEFCKAYKLVRGEAVEMDLFKAFNLSSNTKRYDVNIDWENASNMLDFMTAHPDFTKRTAFLEVFNAYESLMYKNSFFMIYMYFYSEYPVVEFLAKMGYNKIINDALKSIANADNRETMKKTADELTKVFNPSGTSGKISLMIPKYMGDFLNRIKANYRDFAIWSDIYAYEPLSKENFEEYISSKEYFAISGSLSQIANLQKYGYKLFKVSKYIVKQSELLKMSVSSIIQNLIDYRRINELLGTTPDDYPADIEDFHNKAVKSYSMAKNKIDDAKISKVKSYAEKYIPENEEYTIVIPESVYDFVEEGNRQHNCVASYAPRVVNEKCLVFFVRKKEEPDMNYITAEYNYGKLYQIREKNNRPVVNNDAIKYAELFCEKLSHDKFFKDFPH